MKKISKVILVIALGTLLLSSCNAKSEDVDANLAQDIKILELYREKLYNYEITYDEYKEKVGSMFSDFHPNIDDEVIFNYDGIEYSGKNLMGVSLEDMKKHKENIQEKLNIAVEIKRMKISKVYYSDETKYKYIFVEKNEDIIFNVTTGESKEYTNFIRYRFREEDEGWKIMSSSRKHVDSKNMTELYLKKYRTFDDEEIEFIEEIRY